jgi:hypothetical protein
MTRLQSREADAEPNEPGLRATVVRLLTIDLARDPDKLLLLLLGTDAILILLHVLHVYSGYFADLSYSIGMERGFGETFQYFKEGWIVLMLVIIAVRMRGPLYVCWAAFFGLLLADDLFIVRERIGMGIGLELDLGPLFGLRPQDIGELIVIGVFAALLVVPVILAQLLAGADARAFGRSMVLLVVAFVAFGGVFDMIHASVLSHPSWASVLGTVEEDGEMIVMSLIVRFVFQAWHARN